MAQIGGGGGKSSLTSQINPTNSHKLPKIALALLLGGANVALAEESGGFVGIGIGGGGAKYIYKIKDTATNKKLKFINYNGLNYGFMAGYKQFFTPYLGLRYYANLDIFHNFKKFYDERDDIMLLNYGVNVDFLGNFISNESLDFGGFIGVGIGGNSLFGQFIKDLRSVRKEDGYNFSNTDFDVWLNFGLRTNIAKYHGVELVARVPFLPVKMVGEFNEIDSISHKETFGQTFSILARYSFSF